MITRIKELRIEAGLSQTELASKLNTTQKSISNWENGVNQPDFETMIKISELFGTSVDFILGIEHNFSRHLNYSSNHRKLLNVIEGLSEQKKIALLSLLQENK